MRDNKNEMIDSLIDIVKAVHSTCVRQPLRELYFKGPEKLGFWGGAAIEDICFSITSTPSLFWQQHTIQCYEICEQHFTSFFTIINFGLYCGIMLKIVNALVFHVCITRPMIQELRQIGMKRSVPDTVQNHAD